MPWMAFCMADEVASSGSRVASRAESSDAPHPPLTIRHGYFLQVEALPQVELPGLLVANQEFRGALAQHLALVNEVGRVDEAESFADFGAGRAHADAARLELQDHLLH